MAIEIFAAAVRHDAHRAVGEIPQHGCKRLLQMKDDGVIVGRIDTADLRVGACFGAANFAAEQGVEGPLDVARGQRLSVVKANAVMQMKNVGLRIGNFPAVGQPGLQVKVIVAADQRIEEQIVDAFRLRVHADARIEIGGTALDDHDQRVGIGFAGAGSEEQGETRASPRRTRSARRNTRPY